MNSVSKGPREPLRLLFEITRDDNPRLYDDLVRFNKGTKRVNRLRLLAHEGLIGQHWMAASSVVPPAMPPGAVEPVASSSAAQHTNQAFEDPPAAQ